MIELSGPPIDTSNFTETNHPALHYQPMLADRVRMARYRDAITRAVKPGDVVADLGTGLGVLAIMAVQAGAARVYAIDNRPRALWMADHVVRANNASEHIELMEADAATVQLDEPVDLIINELIGDFGTDEGIHETVAGFARNNLKPDGRVLPSRLETYVVPVQYGPEFRGIWSADYHGLDLRAPMRFPSRPSAVMLRLQEAPTELAEPQTVSAVAFDAEMAPRETTIEVAFEIERSAVLQGFVGYFAATLWEDLAISNYPCYPTCHWESWNWPVNPQVEVEPGQRVNATLEQPPRVSAASWSMTWAFD